MQKGDHYAERRSLCRKEIIMQKGDHYAERRSLGLGFKRKSIGFELGS